MKTLLMLGLVTLAGLLTMKQVLAEDSSVIEKLAMPGLDGGVVDPAKYRGKVLLIVNVASQCGLTPQYAGLQDLQDKYGDQGLMVLGFPCNQFGSQEPGSEAEIREFCDTRFGIGFDMFAKINVNGEDACDLYAYLKALPLQPKGPGEVTWNFEKFLVGRDGQVIGRFEPRTTPDDPQLVKAIEAALDKG